MKPLSVIHSVMNQKEYIAGAHVYRLFGNLLWQGLYLATVDSRSTPATFRCSRLATHAAPELVCWIASFDLSHQMGDV